MLRKNIPELLDEDSGTPDEIAGSLADLESFNWWLGGIRTTCKLIERVRDATGVCEFTLLDVAAGSGYVAGEASRRLRSQAGIQLHPVLLDRSPAHLKGADFPCVVGDALALPFADRSFDLVGSNLFLHHLQPAEVDIFLREAMRVCRIAVLINDLRRHPLHLLLAYAGTPLYRSRITRHDAPASVWRAYTALEVRAMAAQAVMSSMVQCNYWMFRSGTVIFRKQRSA